MITNEKVTKFTIKTKQSKKTKFLTCPLAISYILIVLSLLATAKHIPAKEKKKQNKTICKCFSIPELEKAHVAAQK
jgi:hypothetical protein